MNIKELKEAAESIRGDQRDWVSVSWHVVEGLSEVRVRTDREDWLLCCLPGDAYADFIALANPSTILSLIASHDALVEALTFHVRNCPLCRGTRKAVSAWDLLTKDNPEPTECERCAPGWAALETPANPIEEVVDHEPARQD